VSDAERPAISDAERQMWTTWVRERAVRALPPEKLLPDRQPSYVSSWIYVFGVVTIAAFAVIVASGVILGLKGPEWWHLSSIGHFFNSIHLWSVEIFFFAMVVHLWGKFFMGAWRGGRGRTWVTGAITFLVAIGAAFTGYTSQQNFDSQWIASEAKDGLNSVGIGSFFNVADFGQMYTWHVILLPVAVAVLVAGHVLLVRRTGVVPPYPARATATPATPIPTADAPPPDRPPGSAGDLP
jgi:quinol---cytochrome c reductase cytochrome b subunit, bacillus type